MSKEISDFVKAVDCGTRGKLSNTYFIEIGYVLSSQKFNSKEEFESKKADWLANYIKGTYDRSLRSTLQKFLESQNFSGGFLGFGKNNTLYFPNIGKANEQHFAIKQHLLKLGIPTENISTIFNHSNGGNQDAFISTLPVVFKKVPRV